jgi:hypothetical protein
MCVIIIKPKGVQMPKYEVLKAASIANPHGFGFVSEHDYFRTMNFSEFLFRLNEVSDDEACIMHFRLATNGSKRETNCHPFKIGDVFMAHNGIFDVDPRGDITDSEEAFRSILYPAIKKYGWRSREVYNTAMKLNNGYSKIALMRGDDIVTYGRFFNRRGDLCLYSNLRFEYYLQQMKVW